MSLGRAGGHTVQLDLDRWPVEEVTAAVGRVPRAAELHVRMDGYGTDFTLGPLFGIRGLKRVHVEHCLHSQQELDWTGLAGQTGLTDPQSAGWPPGRGLLDPARPATAAPDAPALVARGGPGNAPNSLARLRSLKALEVICLFDPVPDVFRLSAGPRPSSG